MQELREFLNDRLDKGRFSKQSLCRQANELGTEIRGWKPLKADGSDIDRWLQRRYWFSWRRKQARHWIQVAAVAQVLELDEPTAQEFFAGAGWSLDQVRYRARRKQQPILGFRDSRQVGQVVAGQQVEMIAISNDVAINDDGRRIIAAVPVEPETVPKARRLPTFIVVLAMLGVAVAVNDLAATEDAALTPPDEVSETVESGQAEPMNPGNLPAAPVQKRCKIGLAELPYTAKYVIADPLETCPEVQIRHQYPDYIGAPLEPWNEAVAECWAGPDTTLWIGFDLNDQTQGWLPIHDPANRFNETQPTNPELRAEPDSTATVVGNFTYQELSGNAFAIQIDVPEILTPKSLTSFGVHHLGACWQQADTDRTPTGDRPPTKGIHFFWPNNN